MSLSRPTVPNTDFLFRLFGAINDNATWVKAGHNVRVLHVTNRRNMKSYGFAKLVGFLNLSKINKPMVDMKYNFLYRYNHRSAHIYTQAAPPPAV